jgi:hypothetical protein
MTEIDFARWPLLAVSLDEDFGEAELAALVGGLQSALERRSRFVLAIVAPRRLLNRDAHDAAPLRWLRRRRAEVGTWCRGVAYVIADELEPGERDYAARTGGLLWGCPVRIAHDFDEAVGWLTGRL